jgi:hypothetical protein
MWLSTIWAALAIVLLMDGLPLSAIVVCNIFAIHKTIEVLCLRKRR